MIKKTTTNPIKGKALGKTKMEAPSGRIIGQERLAVSKAVDKSNKKRAAEKLKKEKGSMGRFIGKSAAVGAAALVGAQTMANRAKEKARQK